MKLSIVIPAYNEEDRILPTLTRTVSYLNQQTYDSEVLVVSDGSSDGTCSAVTLKYPSSNKVRVQALEYHPNRGKGYAVKYGMLRGTGEHAMFMDADYSVPIEAVEEAFSLIASGADIAIGSRAVAGASIAKSQGFVRSLSGKIYTAIQNIYLGISYKDTQCGFKLFKHGAAQALFKRQKLHSVIFDPEILWLAKQNGFKVAEFPVEWHHHEDSRIQYDSFGKSLFVFQELFRIRKVHGRLIRKIRASI
jgi:dolichyl-phosphate beta-glucosyltransferase